MLNTKNILAFRRRKKGRALPFTAIFYQFRKVVKRSNSILELMDEMRDKLGGEYIFDKQYIRSSCAQLDELLFKLISDLGILTQNRNIELFQAYERISFALQEELDGHHIFKEQPLVMPLQALNYETHNAVGGKMNTLGLIHNLLGHRIPEGFVATTTAYNLFLKHNNLEQKIRTAMDAWDREDEPAFELICSQVRDKIMQAHLPKALEMAITNQADTFLSRNRMEKAPILFAVRSSAWGEEEETCSFSGQYESLLEVMPEDLAQAYKTVVAGAFSPQAWRYRMEAGFREEELSLAVGFQLMVPARVSGVLQTCPDCELGEHILVHSAPGLGAPLMAGTIPFDTFLIERTPPHIVHHKETREKQRLRSLDPEEGIYWEGIASDEHRELCLSPEMALQLVRVSLDIESFFKRPVEIEWAIDNRSNLFILQARSLLEPQHLPDPPSPLAWAPNVILKDKGVTAQQGVGIGKAYIVHNNEELNHVPHGAIVVSRFASPRFSLILSRVRGIITDIGSPTGHMGTLVRERRIPALVNTGNATSLLTTGEEITLDAGSGTVYRGVIPELRRFELTTPYLFEESYEYRLLRRLLKLVVPLQLIDSKSPKFRPANSRTFHDVLRYAHEKAVEKLVELSDKKNKEEVRVCRLNLNLALGLTLIDVEKEITISKNMQCADVRSIPLRALLEGVIQSEMWQTRPVSVDLNSFMSSLTRTFDTSLACPWRVGRNLAVASTRYLSMHLQLGYHFTLLEVFLGENNNDNYIYFRFMGGVTGIERRSRRAVFISEVLRRCDFRTEIHNDLVIGRCKKISLQRGVEKMKILGGLIGYTRQLDALLHNDADLQHHISSFMRDIVKVKEETDEYGQ